MRTILLSLFLILSVQPIFAAQSVTLAWNPNSETNLAGYRLYWGTGSRNYTFSNQVLVPKTDNTVSNLTGGVKYYFAVTAYTTDGLESDYSDEVSYTVPFMFPVALSVNNVANNGRNVRLNWTVTPEPHWQSYKVYVGNSPGNYTQSFVIPVTSSYYDFADLVTGQKYYFAVSIITSSGGESSKSAELVYTVPLSKVLGLRIVP